MAGAHGVPLAAAALQFPLAHPAVLSVIPGMSTSGQVADATRWLDMVIPDALWSDLRGEGMIRADAPARAAA
jgi:D-threo-aldose 1-dehydrogenase